MPIYLASTYFKYSDPQKTNKIGFEDLKSLMCCVFTWIYKDQLFNTISKNEILFSLFPCNHQRISKVNGMCGGGNRKGGWVGMPLSINFFEKSSLAPDNFLKKSTL